jgi:hypothetical protein
VSSRFWGGGGKTPHVMKPALVLLALSMTVACSHGSGRPARLADGGYSLSCKGPLTECLHHAEHLCHDQGYTVSEARDVNQVLGAETGQSRIVIQKSDATIYCGDAPRPAIHLVRQPETEVGGAPAPAAKVAPPASPAPAKAPTLACVPGATQACVGPGGCNGGQACAADGTRFEACDCGK